MPDNRDDGDQSGSTGRFPIGLRSLYVVLLLIAVELGLKHIGGFGWWAATERSERYGWRMLPSQDARSRDLMVTESINSYGFRDREWDEPLEADDGSFVKDESVYRVAVVGNSYTYGTSVPIEQVYSRVLEDLIQADLDARGITRKALVMNFAVQGYCLEQMARVYEDVIRPWKVDLLVVPCHAHDPFPMAPAFDPAEYDFRRWIVRSATYDLLVRHVINRWVPAPPSMLASATDKGGPDKNVDWLQLDKDMLARPFSKEFTPLWEQAGARMQGLDDMLKDDGGRLLLVTLPRHDKYFRPEVHDAAVYWNKWTHARSERVTLVVPWLRFRELMGPLIDEIAAKGMDGSTTHDLTTLSWVDGDGVVHAGDDLEHAESSLNLLHDLGHISAPGHKVMAEEIFGGMQRNKLLPGSN